MWEAWTDPKHVANWWGPKGFTKTIQEMDVKPGGVWKLVMHGPDGTDYPNKSFFVEVVKLERIVFSHSGGKKGGPGAKFQAAWTFVEQGNQTKVTSRLVFKSAEEREQVVKEYGAIEGGKQTLEHLAEFLPKMEPFIISRAFNAPQVSVPGAILLTGYLGGAMSTHLRIGEAVVIQVVLGVFIWGDLFLREPKLREILPVRKLTGLHDR